MAQQQTQGTPVPGQEPPRSLGDQLKLAGALIAGLALVIFFFQNLQDVRVEFLFWDWETDMIWALLVSALLGAAVMFLVQTLLGRRSRPPAKD